MADPVQREKILANFMAPAKLELKVDAQVMLIKNTDGDLVNGTVGKVIGFCDPVAYRGINEATDEVIKMEVVYDLNTQEGKRAYEMKQRLIKEGSIEECPVVKFQVPGKGPRYMFVERHNFTIELPNGEVPVSRRQASSVSLPFVALRTIPC